MSNFKKLLVMICVFALLTVGCVVLALAEEDNAGTVADLESLVEKAEAATAAEAKYSAVIKVSDYLETKKMDPTEEGYDALMARVNAVAVAGADAMLTLVNVDELAPDVAYNGMIKARYLLSLFELPEDTEGYGDVKAKHDEALVKAVAALVAAVDEDIETTLTTAQNQIAINKVKSVIANCAPYSDATSLSESLAQLEELIAAQNRALAINYAKLDEKNYFGNYELPIYIEETWEKNPVGMGKDNLKGDNSWTVDLKATCNQVGIGQEENGNKYYIHKYLEKAKPESTYSQIGLASTDASNGLVFEFDITYFGTLPDKGVFIEPGGVNTSAGRVFPPNYFAVGSKGDIIDPKTGTAYLKGALVKGQWIHIIIVFNPSSFTYTLYVEGEYVAQYDAKYNGSTTYNHSEAVFRLSGQAGTSGDIAYDNIKVYGGDQYRISDRFDKMTDADKFIYYVNYTLNEENDIPHRNTAYGRAGELLSKFWNESDGTYTAEATEAVKACVEDYLAFDIDILLKDVKTKNLATLVDLITQMKQIARTSSTVSARQNKATEINEFIARNRDYFDRESDNDGNGQADYAQYTNEFNQMVREANYDSNASTFIRHIERFQKAPTLSAMQRYYEKAKALIDNDQIDLALIRDTSNPYRKNFKDLVNAYEVYMNADSLLYQLTKENNSYKIVQCMKKISMYTTEEEWLANEELMTKYLFIVKESILGRGEEGDLLYDPEYEGIDEALAFFETSFSFFYLRLQDEHVAYMSEILELILGTEAYIEKMGMVAVIDRYLAANDIDYEDPRIIDILNDLDTCKAELVLREKDYAEVLVQNAVYFINIVNRMRTAATYKEQRDYLEQAAILYFNIDSTVEGAKRAIEIYNEYSVELLRAEESSLKFIELVAIYNACETEDDKYAALVECYYNAQFVEPSFEGVNEAMAEYQKAYDAYYGYANSVNESITLSGNAVGSLRVNCGITTIIAIIIKKIFGV